MKKVAFLLVLLLAVLIIGCATIISGTKQDISVNSTPASASVTVKTVGGVGVFTGTTPATCKLERKREYIVYVRLDGFQEQQIQVSHSFNAWVVGNLVCGGVLGLVIDAVTGAMWNLEPQTIHMEMVTAYHDGKEQLYAVLGALDDDGQLRILTIPMIPERL